MYGSIYNFSYWYSDCSEISGIRCVSECHRWVHKRCSGISGKLKSNVKFHCRRCLEGENGLFQSVLLEEVGLVSRVY